MKEIISCKNYKSNRLQDIILMLRFVNSLVISLEANSYSSLVRSFCCALIVMLLYVVAVEVSSLQELNDILKNENDVETLESNFVNKERKIKLNMAADMSLGLFLISCKDIFKIDNVTLDSILFFAGVYEILGFEGKLIQYGKFSSKRMRLLENNDCKEMKRIKKLEK